VVRDSGFLKMNSLLVLRRGVEKFGQDEFVFRKHLVKTLHFLQNINASIS